MVTLLMPKYVVPGGTVILQVEFYKVMNYIRRNLVIS